MPSQFVDTRAEFLGRREKTRHRILNAAARLFLQRGVDRVGVDEIMHECGLTHGGFYGYFANKEALISDALLVALDAGAEQWKQLAREFGDDAKWNEFLRTYLAGDLASEHNPASRTAILGADVARRPVSNQAGYTARLNLLIDEVGKELGGDRSQAILTVVTLVGATALAAQSGGDKALAFELLNTARSALVKSRPIARVDQ